jgi:hypothetical protein
VMPWLVLDPISTTVTQLYELATKRP